MKHISHYCLSLKLQAQGLGFRPTSWSAVEMISNDRTPEGTSGSVGDGYAK
jgi:hypothetical protein